MLLIISDIEAIKCSYNLVWVSFQTNVFLICHLILKTPGGGALPLAGIRHAPVNRPPFLHRLYTECPLFSQLYTQWPLFLLFRSKFSSDIIKFWKILQIAAKISLKIVKIARILCNFTPDDPPFSDLSPNDPLFCKKIVTDSPLIWCVGRRTPVIFICECPPPPGLKTWTWYSND